MNRVMRLDPLYERCVKVPNDSGQPIAIQFGGRWTKRDFSTSLEEMDRRHPLRWILEQDYSVPNPFQTPLNISRAASDWLMEMNERFPGMFCAEHSHVFPLWCNFQGNVQPLGLLVLDIFEHRKRPLEQTIMATTALLGLVSDILAFRQHKRFERDWVGGLPAFRHDLNLKPVWDVFSRSLGEMFKKSEMLERQAGTSSADAALIHDLRRLREALSVEREHLQVEVNNVLRVQRALNLERRQIIDDLAKYLETLVRRWENQYDKLIPIGVDLDDIRDPVLMLPCDPLVLQESLECLVKNAVSLDIYDRGLLKLDIKVERARIVHASFPEVVSILVTDTGPGIDPIARQYVFIDGFSTRLSDGDSPGNTRRKHRGRGLSVARAQLLRYNGDLQLVDPGPTCDKSSPTGQLGATFAIRFGLAPKNEPLQHSIHEENIHDKTTDS